MVVYFAAEWWCSIPRNIQKIHFTSIAQQHEVLNIVKPKHPLFSILRFEDLANIEHEQRIKLVSDFYQVTLKKDCKCKLKYGQTLYDFDEGIVSFFSPKQLFIKEPEDIISNKGWLLLIHPEFLRGYPLSQKIKTYGFWNYAVNEALILSEEEERSMFQIFEQIYREYHLPLDNFSQEVIISNIDLLLTYSNRYYTRQFVTRKTSQIDLLVQAENLLDKHFNDPAEKGLPKARYLASGLNLSIKYLNDCIKQLTGQTTQQLIHEKLIEHIKDVLTSTELSVSEIAYLIGFEYPQALNKLFKSKTKQTPIEYRQSFN
ncbi:helix-turn-helix domain-containing protein [Pedobacter cryoconitis]|uniref:AraC-like DNA-binding protein n=1 Tax=Pedobacter cryoconitis TaxID=188932 RepID=A0A327RTJ2_9SPHI|nr:helix-turn-helix domain-containing protein [Pedobacter cryoconitis]RAJ19815.1 AraC-like DNA-binding protein [Pedobacter cryoconitis]